LRVFYGFFVILSSWKRGEVGRGGRKEGKR
jgi:hypothetical protein